MPISPRERIRSAVGALLGILATGLLCRWAVGTGSALPVLLAPMGASAVLLFAVPASPLAQPWSIVGGNLIAALVGVSAAQMIGNPFHRRDVKLALARTSSRLALAALSVAIEKQQQPPGCVHHSGRGSQYAAKIYRDYLAKHSIKKSMSRRGNPYDNANVKSFMKS